MHNEFIFPVYFVSKEKDKYTITTEYGARVSLTKEEFEKFRFPDKKLFEKLEKACVIITEKNAEKIANFYKKRFFIDKKPEEHVIVGEPPNQVIKYVKNLAKKISEKSKVEIKKKASDCKDKICSAILAKLAYDEKGDIYPCEQAVGMKIFKIGNVFENPALNKEAVESFLSFSVFNPLCLACPKQAFCAPCLVNIFKKYGRLGIVDKINCKN